MAKGDHDRWTISGLERRETRGIIFPVDRSFQAVIRDDPSEIRILFGLSASLRLLISSLDYSEVAPVDFGDSGDRAQYRPTQTE